MVPSASSSPPPGRTWGNQPSATRPTRRSAAGAKAPIQMGIGRCTGSGAMPAAVMWWKRPSVVTLSCVHSARSTATCSSRMAARCAKGTPSASYSTLFQPMPRPRRKRPPQRMSSSAACLANSAVWRWGPIRMEVAKARFVVQPAR